MTIFHTESGSVYEVGNHAVRRLEGKHDPTPRQGKDGDWREFLTHTELTVGQQVVFGWCIEDGVLRSTITSKVTKIENTHCYDCRSCGGHQTVRKITSGRVTSTWECSHCHQAWIWENEEGSL